MAENTSNRIYTDDRFNKLSQKLNNVLSIKAKNKNKGPNIVHSTKRENYQEENNSQNNQIKGLSTDSSKRSVKHSESPNRRNYDSNKFNQPTPSQIDYQNNDISNNQAFPDQEQYYNYSNNYQSNFSNLPSSNRSPQLQDQLYLQKDIVSSFYEESSTFMEVESKLEKLEERSFHMKKDHELKAKLLQDELNYLVRTIELSKEEEIEIQRKIDNELHKTTQSLLELVDNHFQETELTITSIFAGVEKKIDEMVDNCTFKNKELIEAEEAQSSAIIASKNLNQYFESENEYTTKEIEELYNELNSIVAGVSNELDHEEKTKEKREAEILEFIEGGLLEMKKDFAFLREQREAQEEEIFNKLERTCIELVYKFNAEED